MLDSGDCTNDAEYKILAFSVKIIDSDVYLLLPPEEELDALIGSKRWMIRKATAQVFGRNKASAIEIVGPKNMDDEEENDENGGLVQKKEMGGECGEEPGSGCGSNKLEW